jgi:hypothetical protein
MIAPYRRPDARGSWRYRDLSQGNCNTDAIFTSACAKMISISCSRLSESRLVRSTKSLNHSHESTSNPYRKTQKTDRGEQLPLKSH